MVRFSLAGSGAKEGSAESLSATAYCAQTARRIADLKDQARSWTNTIQDQRKKADVGIASANDVPKLEVELRQLDREIEDLTTRLAECRPAAGRAPRR